MLASPSELGIGSDHSGIVDLGNASFDLKPDHIIEVDNKSLTHRPDLWGHHGMAREVAAITGKTLLDPVPNHDLNGEPAIEITVTDSLLCPRYSALVFENVTVKPSPLWLQYRLEAIGLNTINNIVDVTNFILAELPQPMHAFDADKLQGDEIIVRTARVGEKMAALNGETYELDPSNLVIADAENAIGLAGVIGGADSAISDSTTTDRSRKREFQRVQRSQNIVAIEAAHRRFHAIRKIAGPVQHGSRIEARAGAAGRSFAGDQAGWRTRRRLASLA